MEQEKFIQEIMKDHGGLKAPEELLSNVMSEIELEEHKVVFQPLMAPWLVKVIVSLLVGGMFVLLVLLSMDGGGSSYIKFPEWHFSIPEIQLDLSTVVLSAVIAVLFLVIFDVRSHRKKVESFR